MLLFSSPQFYEHHLGPDKGAKEEDNPKSKYYRWRQRTKQLKKVSQPSVDSSSIDQEMEGEEEQNLGEEEGEEEEKDDEVGEESIPTQAQIVDTESIVDGIRPHTVYCIMVKRDSGEAQVMAIINYCNLNLCVCVCVCVCVTEVCMLFFQQP